MLIAIYATLGIVFGFLMEFISSHWISVTKFRYKVLPIIAPVLIALLVINNFKGYTLFFLIFLCLTTLLISYIDLHLKIIPNKIIIIMLVFGIIYRLIDAIYMGSFEPLTNGLLGLLVGFGLYALIIIISKGKMGGGDAKLMAIFGLFLGFKSVLLITYFGCLIATIIMVPLVLASKMKLKAEIPFAPFLAIGLYFMLFFEHVWSVLINF